MMLRTKVDVFDKCRMRYLQYDDAVAADCILLVWMKSALYVSNWH